MHFNPCYSYSIKVDGSISTPGVDFGGKITVIYSSADGIHQIWKKSSGSVWSGRGEPRDYVPVELWIVKTSPNNTFTIDQLFVPGRNFNKVLVEMIKQLELQHALEMWYS